MLFFATRTAARAFKSKNEKFKLVDNGTNSWIGRRWAVVILKK